MLLLSLLLIVLLFQLLRFFSGKSRDPLCLLCPLYDFHGKPICDLIMVFYWYKLSISHFLRDILNLRFQLVGLTFSSHQRSNISTFLESRYASSSWSSIDTNSLSCTVYEIFDFHDFASRPSPLSPQQTPSLDHWPQLIPRFTWSPISPWDIRHKADSQKPDDH